MIRREITGSGIGLNDISVQSGDLSGDLGRRGQLLQLIDLCLQLARCQLKASGCRGTSRRDGKHRTRQIEITPRDHQTRTDRHPVAELELGREIVITKSPVFPKYSDHLILVLHSRKTVDHFSIPIILVLLKHPFSDDRSGLVVRFVFFIGTGCGQTSQNPQAGKKQFFHCQSLFNFGHILFHLERH